jgi:hypothetical protein
VAFETKQAHSQAEAERTHLAQDLCLSEYTRSLPGLTKMEVYPAVHHLDYRYSTPTQGHQVQERLDVEFAETVGSMNHQAWPKEAEVQMCHSAALELEVVVVVDFVVVGVLAVQREDHICLQVDELSIEEAVPSFEHYALPHFGRQMAQLRLLRRAKCVRIDTAERVRLVAGLQNCIAEAAVHSMAASVLLVVEATIYQLHHSHPHSKSKPTGPGSCV